MVLGNGNDGVEFRENKNKILTLLSTDCIAAQKCGGPQAQWFPNFK